MTCHDFDRLLTSPSAELPPAAQKHLDACPRCRALVGALTADEGATSELRPALAAAIAGRISAGLTPVRPLAPRSHLTAGFASIFAVLALLGGVALGDHAFQKMDWLTASITYASLAIAAGLLARALAAQMAPGSRQLARPWILTLGILLGLAFVFADVFPYERERAFALNAWRCLRTGLAAGSLAGALFWLVLRRGAVLDPRSCGALAGLLGGLTGTTLLEIHCPDFNAAHILVGHWAAGLLCAAIGWFAGGIAARRE